MGIEIESEKRGIGVTKEMGMIDWTREMGIENEMRVWIIGRAKKRRVVRDDNAMRDRPIERRWRSGRRRELDDHGEAEAVAVLCRSRGSSRGLLSEILNA
jgi:hypothetical protein